MEEDGFGKLGFYSLGVQAVFQGLGSLLSTAIVRKIGSLKVNMVIGAATNSLWVLQSIIPALRNA
jgi:MFS family permease